MPKVFWVVTALAVSVFVGLHIEWWRHRRALARIPLRIHVNGTRGKSSVTRLLASVLRAQGIRTVAKTTGTTARLILPDGSERPVGRDGPPNVGEMVRTMREAARLGAEAVVFECMAVAPELQWVVENQMVRPTVTVVTNARLDHTDQQGASLRDIARTFAVRRGGTLVTADPLVAEVLGPRLEFEGGSTHLASADTVGGAGLAGTAYVEHPENVALVLEVTRMLGVSREVALDGMGQAEPDTGAALVIDVPDPSGEWTLVDLFAANDPESTFRALETVESTFDLRGRPVALFASRGDRAARSAEFAAAFARHHGRFSTIVVWGERTPAVVRLARRRGVPPELVFDAGSCSPYELTELLVESMDGTRTVVGLGNIVGPAQRFLAHVAERLE